MFQKIRYGILSQLFPDFMSTLIYRFDMNLRDATVLGQLVGAGGIGACQPKCNAYKWNQVGAICRTDRADSDCGGNLHKRSVMKGDAGITIIRLRDKEQTLKIYFTSDVHGYFTQRLTGFETKDLGLFSFARDFKKDEIHW